MNTFVAIFGWDRCKQCNNGDHLPASVLVNLVKLLSQVLDRASPLEKNLSSSRLITSHGIILVKLFMLEV